MIVAISATGCGVSGTPTAGELDLRRLDTGPYPIEPIETGAEYDHSMLGGRLLAGMRLADNVVTGSVIDPALTYGSADLIPDAAWVHNYMTEANRTVLERNRYLYGVVAGSTNNKSYDVFVNYAADDDLAALARRKNPAFISTFIMQFPDATAATRAAAELEETDFQVAADGNQRVPLAKHQEAHTHWRPGVPTIGSAAAHGSYVVYLNIGLGDPNLDRLAELTEKTYDAQFALLDKLPALSPKEVLRLDNDPQDILRRVLNPGRSVSPSAIDFFSYGPTGFLNWTRSLRGLRDTFAAVGADRFGVGWGTIAIRTRDADAARALAPKLLQPPGIEVVATDAPPNIPGGGCVENRSELLRPKRFSCTVPYHRYVAMVESNQIVDVHQKVAAQYALFANSE
ncbi:DUF7373 family lipoprotein [Nocardia arthritidis]|uniref:Uncharacterized protein n=1 Tax=Nocardia arthritidis TaxID=228602 RepID=A0A6G9Y7D7_9NOCA|nr:hypothetical protein [Nocardia arthritidis]QIS09054.1 hypothetical protein F5544_05710 [Nocardia arthritidis]